MTGFDWAVIGVVLLSTLLAFWRGLIRVVVSLASWVLAFVAGVQWTSNLAPSLPQFAQNPAVRYVVAFVLIVIAVLVVGTLVGWALAHAVRAIGLGFLDRLLGGVAGLARGVLIVLVFVLVAGLTTMPQRDWWQNAYLSAPLATAALSLRPWLPKVWSDRLEYGPEERRGRAAPTTRI